MKSKLLLVVLASTLLVGCGPTKEDITSQGTNTDETRQKFLRARNETYVNRVYEYNYVSKAQIKYGNANFSPVQLSGKVQYNANGINTQYLHKRDVTGALVFDYSTYTYNDGLDFITLNANENKDFSIVSKQQIPDNYEFENNSIGLILKTITENGLLKVTKSEDKYVLDLQTNFAQDSLLSVLNYVDSRKVIDALSDYTKDKWGVGFTYNCYVKLNAQETSVSAFHFDASVTIKDTLTIGFEFDQSFSKVGSGVTIELPTFDNTITNTSQISEELSIINESLNNAKKYYYDYKLKTGVDHGVSKTNILGLAVNSTSQGYARREIIDNEVFFHNRLEVDSDYKNNDQLGNLVKDYERYRAKLNNSNKDVYDVEDVIGPKNEFTLIDPYDNDAIDDYYMMINSNWLSNSSVKIMRKTIDRNNNTIYRLGISGDTIKQILEYYNDSIRIDPLGITPVKVYDIRSSFEARKCDFEITLDENGNMTDINIDLKGFYVCQTNKQVKFTFSLDLEFDKDAATYTAPSKKEDIKLSANVK